jgi:hypothetical protein
VRTRLSRGDLLSVAALCIVWVGIWGPWIPDRAAALSQNALYLAEWSGVLPGVRGGPLMAVPDLLRLAVMLSALALFVVLGAVRFAWVRWAMRAAAALLGLVLLPPYPFVLQLWSGSYGTQFIIAATLFVGLGASLLVDRLTVQARRSIVIGLSVCAAGLGAWAFLKLRLPFEAHYAVPIMPGWGVLAFVGGLAVAVLLEAAVMVRHSRQRAALMA